MAPSRDDAFAEGTTVGRHRLARVIGEGGMGIVWAARDEENQRDVALKLLRDVRRDDPVSHARFLREAEAAMKVRHPNVARVHAIEYTDGGTPYLVMDLLEGESLRERLRGAGGRLSPEECARVLRPVVAAVKAAHEQGLVHRDLKPENVFLATDGVRVLDFGIAKRFDGDADTFTSTGALVGTPAYMAPEQIFGERELDAKTDVWALGVMLYECLSGTRPVDGGMGPILKAITSGDVVPLAERVPGQGLEDVSRFVMRMLARKPADRPSIDEVAALLDRLEGRGATDAPTSRTLASGAPPAPARRARARGGRWVALGALGVAVVGGWFAWSALHANAAPAAAAPSTSASWTEPVALAPSSAPSAAVGPASAVASSASSVAPVATVGHGASPGSHASATAPSAAAGAHPAWVLDVVPGVHGGIGEVGTIPAFQTAAETMKPCLPPATDDERWSVSVACRWPKGGPREVVVEVRRNDALAPSPQADAIASCARQKLDAASIPPAVGQDDLGGKPAYASMFVGYFRAR